MFQVQPQLVSHVSTLFLFCSLPFIFCCSFLPIILSLHLFLLLALPSSTSAAMPENVDELVRRDAEGRCAVRHRCASEPPDPANRRFWPVFHRFFD